jgi:hypothetical protein
MPRGRLLVVAIASWLRTDSATPNPPGNAVPSPRACTAVSEAMTICADCQRFMAENAKNGGSLPAERAADDRLRLLDDGGEMVGAFQALGIKFVDVLRT